MAIVCPEIAVDEIYHSRGKKFGTWMFGWRITNLTGEPLRVLTARLPHGKFRSGEHLFRPFIEIDGGGDAAIELLASCSEAPGTEVENAFVILEVEWQQVRWRIFVRFRVSVNSSGDPGTRTELITTQRVGFSTGG